jgi:type II secretory pathway component GspD/PulD (secretin)
VQWAVSGSKNGTQITTGTDYDLSDRTPTGALRNFDGFSSSITGGNVNFVLRALEADGRLEVLSRPQILTADNQKATIDIGERVPLITDTRITGENANIISSYTYENVGVSLTVTPRISPDGSVKMEVEPIVSQLSSAAGISVGNNITTPIISQRKATTTVSVQDGQSVIIGGLISTVDDRRRSKVPILGNIPYLGALFRSSRSTSDRKELLIILTPQLLSNNTNTVTGVSSMQQVTKDQLRRSTIKDEIRRDKLQQEVLEPIVPFFDGTNSVAPGPKL